MMKRVNAFIKRKKKLVIIFSIVAVSLVTFSFVEDYYFEVSKNLDIFTTAYRNVNIYYVDSIQPGELMERGINSMLKTLDPYTVYIPEADIEDYRMTHVSAEYGGIGALVHERNGEIEISEVYEGFPAQKGDMRPGDKILSVNGISVASRKVDDVTEYLKGAKGSKVTVLLRRDGEEKPIEKALYRDEIKFKNEIINGKHTDKAPDIVFFIRDMKYTTNRYFEFGSNKLFGRPHRDMSGDHRNDGIIIAYGKQIQSTNNPIAANMVDLAPTILRLFKLPIPQTMDGKILEMIIDKKS